MARRRKYAPEHPTLDDVLRNTGYGWVAELLSLVRALLIVGVSLLLGWLVYHYVAVALPAAMQANH